MNRARFGIQAPVGALPTLEEYLTRLDTALPLPGRARRRIITEIADGLDCAVGEQIANGVPPAEAAAAVTAEFGDPIQLAAMFTTEHARATAHRVGLGLVATGPLVGLTWLSGYAAVSGESVTDEIVALLTANAWLPVLLAVSLPAAVLASAGAGRWSRILHVPPTTAVTAACVATMACMVADTLLLTAGLRADLLNTSHLLWLAAAASATRLSAVVLAGRRCLRLRVAVR